MGFVYRVALFFVFALESVFFFWGGGVEFLEEGRGASEQKWCIVNRVNAFSAGNPFWGANFLEISIGRGFRALKGFSSMRRGLILLEWHLCFCDSIPHIGWNAASVARAIFLAVYLGVRGCPSDGASFIVSHKSVFLAGGV